MTKQAKKITIISFLLVSIVITLILGYDYYQNKTSLTKSIQTIPELKLTTLNKDSVKIPKQDSAYRFILDYHPGCEYCEKYLSDFVPLTKSISNYKFLFITSSDVKSIRQTIKRYGVSDNISYLHDPEYSMDIFPSVVTPSYYVYDPNGNLIDFQIGYESAKSTMERIQSNE